VGCQAIVNIQNLHQAAECVLCKKQSFATAAGGSRKLSVTDKCPYIKASCAAGQAGLTCEWYMVNNDALNFLQVDTPVPQQAAPQPSSTAPDHPKEPQESVWAEGSVSQVKPTALSTSLTIPDIDSFCIGKQIAILPCSMPGCVYTFVPKHAELLPLLSS